MYKLENFQFFSHPRGIKCRPKANNNREAVVVCARHVVKRPNKRSVLVYYILGHICIFDVNQTWGQALSKGLKSKPKALSEGLKPKPFF